MAKFKLGGKLNLFVIIQSLSECRRQYVQISRRNKSLYRSSMLYLLIAIAILIFGLKFYTTSTKWNGSYKCLVGKTAIVTGSNTGIGYYTALDFAKRGARVILACRNSDKANKAKDEIVRLTGNEQVVVKIVDFSSLESVRNFCDDFNATEERLDILVNNAAGVGLGNRITSDNLQISWQTNHFSTFLLTHLLIDKLKQCAPSRIVNVASLLAKFGSIDLANLNKYPDPQNLAKSDYILYTNTKLANILFTRELHKRVFASGICTNTLHPGSVATEIYRRLPAKKLFYTIINFMFKTPEEGAQTNIYCGISSELDGVSGEYFINCTRVKLYKNCLDSKLGEELWRVSEEIVKLKESEKIKQV